MLRRSIVNGLIVFHPKPAVELILDTQSNYGTRIFYYVFTALLYAFCPIPTTHLQIQETPVEALKPLSGLIEVLMQHRPFALSTVLPSATSF